MDPPPPYNAANNSLNDSKHPASASDKPKPPDYPQPLEPGPPLRYDFPRTFAIGARRTNAPLVSSAQLKDHLALLHAFTRHRARTDGLYRGRNEKIPFLPREGERKWGWFVGLAVERFSVWCEGLREGDLHQRARDVLPSVDVLMVWHAHMLNPSWDAEDCSRINALRGLKSLTSAFSNYFAFELEDILTSKPTQSRVDVWDTTTRGRHFDPIRDAELHHTRKVLCPKCRRSLLIAYVKEDSTGFFQKNFHVQCPSYWCQNLPRFTRPLLGARKLAEDLAGMGVKADVATPSLAGTLRTSRNATDTARGKLGRDTIPRGPSFRKPAGNTEEWIIAILTQNKYDLEVLKEAMAGNMNAGGGNLLTRITSAYQTAYVFSVDLVGAVLWQGSFVKKMYDLQWTQPGFFDSKDDEVALQHSIVRYHALFLDSFLDLMSASNTSFFVPTLDIDLAWHTHQLLWQTYNNDVKHFGTQKSYLIPPAREDLLAATHPSDHNAIFAWHRKHLSEGLQQCRREKFKERQERDVRERRKGKGKERRRVDAHEAAFLVPVPLYYGYGGCAAYTGAVVYSANDNGIGGCAAVSPQLMIMLATETF
ncbi:hypothetical protein DXG01_001935 [Tephrocybe rancida]|nr:hypothetical protein DXG01_001935 [Tephrocybe rancida]